MKISSLRSLLELIHLILIAIAIVAVISVCGVWVYYEWPYQGKFDIVIDKGMTVTHVADGSTAILIYICNDQDVFCFVSRPEGRVYWATNAIVEFSKSKNK